MEETVHSPREPEGSGDKTWKKFLWKKSCIAWEKTGVEGITLVSCEKRVNIPRETG